MSLFDGDPPGDDDEPQRGPHPNREITHVSEAERAERVARDDQGKSADLPRIIALGVCPKGRCAQVHRHCIGHRSNVIDWDGVRREPCRLNAMRGQNLCRVHGGKVPKNRKAAEAKMEEARIVGEVGKLLDAAHLTVAGLGLGDQLVGALNTAGAMALSYRWLLDALPTESTWTYERNTTDAGSLQRFVKVDVAGLHGPDAAGTGRLHAYEEGLRYWTKLHGELLVKAAALGLEERRQMFEEAQVARIGDAIIGMVHGLGRDLDDPEVVPIVEATLQAIAGDSTVEVVA